jgi:hypothetical protein
MPLDSGSYTIMRKRWDFTVQILSPGLDCGIPVLKSQSKYKERIRLKSLQIMALHESKISFNSALKTITIPEPGIIEVEKPGKLYTLPDLRQWLFFKMNIFRRKLGFNIDELKLSIITISYNTMVYPRR